MKNNKIWYQVGIVLLLFAIYMLLRWRVMAEIHVLECFFIGYGFGSLVFDILLRIDR